MPQAGLVGFLRSSLTNDGLLAHGLETEREPRLAERWELLDGGRTIRFHIRPGVTFSDGTPVTPSLVRQSLALSQASPIYPLLRSIVEIRAGDTTLDVALTQPSDIVLDDLSVPITLSRGTQPPFGAGPFVVDRDDGDVLQLRARAEYYRGRPAIDGIDIRSYPTVHTAWTAMLRDEIDFLYEVPWDARELVAQEPSVQIHSFLRAYIYTLVFNTRRPVFADPALRVALGSAIDRARLVEVALRGRGLPAKGPIWPGYTKYEADLKHRSYDPAGARAAIEQIERSRGPIRFRCVVVYDRAPHEIIAINLQRAFRDVGVDMEIVPVMLEKLGDLMAKRDFDAVLTEAVAGPGLARLPVTWHSSSSLGYGGADAELEALSAAVTEDELRQAAFAMQRVFDRDPPALFIFWSETARALSRRFDPGVHQPGRDIIAGIWQWRPAGQTAMATVRRTP
jgi:peptide/nickel transport system substrate-binding protein